MTLAEQIKGLHDNTTLLASAIPSLPPVPIDFTVADLKAMVAENERMRGYVANECDCRCMRCQDDAREALGDKV